LGSYFAKGRATWKAVLVVKLGYLSEIDYSSINEKHTLRHIFLIRIISFSRRSVIIEATI
jgi:hypothetical protein